MSRIDPGQLSERLVALHALRLTDDAGGVQIVWSEGEAVWADWTPLASHGVATEARRSEVGRHVFLMRDCPVAWTAERFLWRERALDVLSRRYADKTARFVMLECEERR